MHDNKESPHGEEGSQNRKHAHAPDLNASGTATVVSAPEPVDVSPVPLYLIPQAVACAVREHGRAVREIHVRRTRNHQYAIEVRLGRL